MNNTQAVLAVLAAVFIASVSQLLLKAGANKSYPTLIRQYLNPYVVFGYALMVLSTLLFILAIIWDSAINTDLYLKHWPIP